MKLARGTALRRNRLYYVTSAVDTACVMALNLSISSKTMSAGGTGLGGVYFVTRFCRRPGLWVWTRAWPGGDGLERGPSLATKLAS
jgi:hypothetical protein